MTHHWDEFSKSLAEPLPRRESLRRLGLVVSGAVLSPLGLESAFAGKADPCKAFCKCRNKRQQDQCLRACKSCNKDTRRLCGDCGNYVCCASGRVCCNGYYCVDLANDVANCGACGNDCYPGPWEYSACIDGRCEYVCAEGAVRCNGACTDLEGDSGNCGACGNDCPASAPACLNGVCSECPAGSTNCGGYCANLLWDTYNCGACPGTPCVEGVCDFGVPADQFGASW